MPSNATTDKSGQYCPCFTRVDGPFGSDYKGGTFQYQTAEYQPFIGGYGAVFPAVREPSTPRAEKIALKIYGYGGLCTPMECQGIADDELEGWREFGGNHFKGFLPPLNGEPELVYVRDANNPGRVYPAMEMEYVEGEPLLNLMGKGGMDRGLFFRMFSLLLEYLTPFCEKYSHGDLNPSNIIVTGRPRYKDDPFDIVFVDYSTIKRLPDNPQYVIANRGWSHDGFVPDRARNYVDVYGIGNVLEGMLRGNDPPAGFYVDAAGEKSEPPQEERIRRLRGTDEKLVQLVLDMTMQDAGRLTMAQAKERFKEILMTREENGNGGSQKISKKRGKPVSFLRHFLLPLIVLILAPLILDAIRTPPPPPPPPPPPTSFISLTTYLPGDIDKLFKCANKRLENKQLKTSPSEESRTRYVDALYARGAAFEHGGEWGSALDDWKEAARDFADDASDTVRKYAQDAKKKADALDRRLNNRAY